MTRKDEITVVETEQRLRAVLKGAFATPPTPLKHIPKKKAGPHQPDTKAEHAKFKRSDKMVFKPAPKKS